ncbi:MAG: FAD-binding oxidoreductase [Bacteroidia bacterium]
MSESVDFLIVGAGISGLCLHNELLNRGHTSIIVNNDERNVSTSIAAGIVNPVAGKFFSLTWRANDFFPSLESYYRDLETKTQSSFYFSKEIRRVISSAGEQNIWLSKSHLEKYKGYCQYIPSKDDFGQIQIHRGGHLDTTAFTNNMRIYLKDKAPYRNEIFNHELLELDSLSYDNIRFKKIVFCEGYDMINNPYFKHLPFSPNKGELIEIESGELDENLILTGAVFVLPTGNQKFKVGATYEHHIIDLVPTLKNKAYLLERFEKMSSASYEVVNQFVGIRPAVKDRRPLLGQHPKHECMFIMNGLGSKGVSMAPQLSRELADFMISGKELNNDCNINRF